MGKWNESFTDESFFLFFFFYNFFNARNNFAMQIKRPTVIHKRDSRLLIKGKKKKKWLIDTKSMGEAAFIERKLRIIRKLFHHIYHPTT